MNELRGPKSASDRPNSAGRKPSETLKLDLKLYLHDESAEIDARTLIPVFHRWIQTRRLDELMLDVADYSHVPRGPGVLLICHGAHYAFDQGADGPGLLYSLRRAPRRHPGPGYVNQVVAAVTQALQAAAILEQEEELAGRLRFDGAGLRLWINDRLRAPGLAAAERFRALVETSMARIYPSGAEVKLLTNDARDRLGFTVAARESLSVEELLERLSEPAVAVSS